MEVQDCVYSRPFRDNKEKIKTLNLISGKDFPELIDA